ncbi:hypothetical protein SAMN02745216_02838 [Desulfatibacillum alkenivorans DSM 16219]|jgi:predicted nucleotidyltransferase component of viral defense system|uniref:Nucleotidyl transferase AbiEii toxin, Type IV TA system n=1 Tax=Desulfatibacillum alkenivorans DSM 16219 TaxID=1121393 RepID=A0A1M6PHN3_9BACT|nr:nucleotidyl transferase AbiEii/AbiGii toxin family protein [Desulfatibacillum alkenivorans]SHK07432.1 hypothetical protein SAMN02745216_02838 [Desulfatibacillum alkenivorans DSM 16219]
MKLSPEKLMLESERTGFRPDLLEKVAHLLHLLSSFQNHPFLKGKLALKGGTALNLFFLDVPRLSIDIDLNYVAQANRDEMIKDRPKVEQALTAVFAREGFTVKRMPEDHAGGKWILGYQGAFGQHGNLEVDLNFMFRLPLWPVVNGESKSVGSWVAHDIPLLDIHEIAAGKLAALFARRQARDLFDCYELFEKEGLDQNKIRSAFIAYGAMNRKDWRTVSLDDVNFDARELAQHLTPTLRTNPMQGVGNPNNLGERLVSETKTALGFLFPFSDSEKEFLDRLLDSGELLPALITDDPALRYRIQEHPLLAWKALNVRKYKKLE